MCIPVILPIFLDDELQESVTVMEPSGGDAVLTITTTVPAPTLLLRSVYVGAGGQSPGIVSTVTISRERRDTLATVLPDVPVTHARGRCLMQHAQSIQEHLEAITLQSIRVVLSDQAVQSAERAFPRAP